MTSKNKIVTGLISAALLASALLVSCQAPHHDNEQNTDAGAAYDTAADALETSGKGASGDENPAAANDTVTENNGAAADENASGASTDKIEDSSAAISGKTGQPTAATEAAASGTTGEAVYLDYIDAWEEWHTMEVIPTVPKNIYDAEKFTADSGDPQWVTYSDPAYTVLQGIDIYEGTGEIDWQAVADGGYSFAFVRVGYRGYGQAGKLCEDYRAVENLRAAKNAGLKVGAYFFSQALNEEEAREEAETAVKVIEESGVELDLPLMYDPEIIKNDDGRANDITREQVSLNTKAFRETVESISDCTVDIYSNLPWEDRLFDAEILSDFDIWYADYEKIPQTPYHFTWWQYSNKGSVPGIAGDVDLDLWIVK